MLAHCVRLCFLRSSYLIWPSTFSQNQLAHRSLVALVLGAQLLMAGSGTGDSPCCASAIAFCGSAIRLLLARHQWRSSSWQGRPQSGERRTGPDLSNDVLLSRFEQTLPFCILVWFDHYLDWPFFLRLACVSIATRRWCEVAWDARRVWADWEPYRSVEDLDRAAEAGHPGPFPTR